MTDELLIDIGGTAVKYGLVNGEAMQVGVFPVREADGSERMPTRLTELVRSAAPRRIAVSTPGPFDYTNGIARMKDKLRSLWEVSLIDVFHAVVPEARIMFLHDAVSYLLGVMEAYPALRHGIHCAVTLGTGLGYTCAKDGRIFVDDKETPAGKLWNLPYKDAIGEYYVSAIALLRFAKEKGYSFQGVKEMAETARNGSNEVRDIFTQLGRDLGNLLNQRLPLDRFETVVIGGQISQAFDLLRDGFNESFRLPYMVPDSPTRYPLLGLHYALKHDKQELLAVSDIMTSKEHLTGRK